MPMKKLNKRVLPVRTWKHKKRIQKKDSFIIGNAPKRPFRYGKGKGVKMPISKGPSSFTKSQNHMLKDTNIPVRARKKSPCKAKNVNGETGAAARTFCSKHLTPRSCEHANLPYDGICIWEEVKSIKLETGYKRGGKRMNAKHKNSKPILSGREKGLARPWNGPPKSYKK